MPIIYQYDNDKELDLDDLPLERWVTIQKATGRKWGECMGAHLFEDAEIALAVLGQCAEQTGSTLPDPLKLSDLFSIFKVTAIDNRPSEFTDGIPDPKASDSEPGTTS